MNEKLAKLYDQALVLEGNGDYISGELDPVKFAELIVKECAEIASNPAPGCHSSFGNIILEHFGIE